MTVVDIADETFVVAEPETVAAVVGDPASWARWWPGLSCEVYRDRGAKGRQWRVSGDLVGTAEIWLEPFRDGVLVHWYLRVDPPVGRRPPSSRGLRRLRRGWVVAWKRNVAALKAELEDGRPPGEPRLKAAAPPAE